MEMMRNGLSSAVVSRIANAALLDYEVITAEDTSQRNIIGLRSNLKSHILLFSVVTPSKLYQASLKLGAQLNSEAITEFQAKPPSFVGFDGKVMNVKSFSFDERGVQHPVQNKQDQIGK